MIGQFLFYFILEKFNILEKKTLKKSYSFKNVYNKKLKIITKYATNFLSRKRKE